MRDAIKDNIYMENNVWANAHKVIITTKLEENVLYAINKIKYVIFWNNFNLFKI